MSSDKSCKIQSQVDAHAASVQDSILSYGVAEVIAAWKEEADEAKEEAAELRADLERQYIIAANAYANACAADPDFDRHDCSIQSDTRSLLIKALAGLASLDPSAQAKAGGMAEMLRAKSGLTWNQLIVKEADHDDLDDLDQDGDDHDGLDLDDDDPDNDDLIDLDNDLDDNNNEDES